MNDLLYGELSHVDEHVDHQYEGLHGDVLENDNDSTTIWGNILTRARYNVMFIIYITWCIVNRV